MNYLVIIIEVFDENEGQVFECAKEREISVGIGSSQIIFSIKPRMLLIQQYQKKLANLQLFFLWIYEPLTSNDDRML